MRNNMQYMIEVPSQFTGERKTQRESNQRAAEKAEPRKTLDWMIRTALGTEAIGLGQIFPYASRQVNPTEFFAGLLSDMAELRAVSTVTEDQWLEFLDSVTEFLSTLDESNSESMMHSDRWAEIDVEDNSWSDPESDPYMESQFAIDVADTENEWNFPKYTVGARNWGFYNEAATQDYAFSLMRVRWFANMLLIGGMKVKSSGLAECGVSGCRWSHQLRSNSVEGSEVFDRRYAEYQVLLILAHLGEHTRTNPRNYWTPIDCVKRGRDTATMKLDSASKFC
jgi:hypothetical protein